MKFSDMLKFSANYLRKHKARFVIITAYSMLLILLIFILINASASVVATGEREVGAYIDLSGGKTAVGLSCITLYKGNDGVREYRFITREDIALVQEELGESWQVETDVSERRNGVRFMGSIIFPEVMDGTLPVLQGSGEEAGSGNIWISEQAAAYIGRYGMGVGSSINIDSGYTEDRFTIAGIVDGDSEVYALEEDMVRMGLLMLNVEFNVILERGSYEEAGEFSAAISRIEGRIDADNLGILHSELASYYRDINLISGIFAAVFAAAAVFCTLLLLSVLRNNAVVGIYDNIGFFAMLSCMGIRRRDVGVIAMLETMACVFIAALAAVGLSAALAGVSAAFVGAVMSRFMLTAGGGVVVRLWWAGIVYAVALAAAVALYFILTLQKVLSKKNLLSVVRSEL